MTIAIFLNIPPTWLKKNIYIPLTTAWGLADIRMSIFNSNILRSTCLYSSSCGPRVNWWTSGYRMLWLLLHRSSSPHYNTDVPRRSWAELHGGILLYRVINFYWICLVEKRHLMWPLHMMDYNHTGGLLMLPTWNEFNEIGPSERRL